MGFFGWKNSFNQKRISFSVILMKKDMAGGIQMIQKFHKKSVKFITSVLCTIAIVFTSICAGTNLTVAQGATFWEKLMRLFAKQQTTTEAFSSMGEEGTEIFSGEDLGGEKESPQEQTASAGRESDGEEQESRPSSEEQTTEAASPGQEETDTDTDDIEETALCVIPSEETTEADNENEPQKSGLTPGMKNRKKVKNKAVKLKNSQVADTAALKYYADGDNYRYGITRSGKEVLAFKSSDGTFQDALQGAGNYVIRDTSFWNYISYNTEISRYEAKREDGIIVLTVYYKTSNATAASSTTYRFYSNHVSVTANIENIENTAKVGDSYFERSFVNGYIDYEIRQNTKWVFPEDGDFPYKDFDSIVTTHYLDATHKMYTFFRGENANTCKYFDEYSPEHLPLMVANQQLNSYELTYDLVFEQLVENRDSDYLALFESDNSQVAAGITPVTEGVENSSVFTTNNVEFNINVTNLLKRAVKYNLRYRIYDYYGNVYHDTNETEVLAVGRERNIPVAMKNMHSGIYYLELEVATETGSYRELYPFGYLPEHEYRYNETSPFGISGIRFGDYQQNDTTIELMKTLGMANARVGISKPEYVNESFDLLKNSLSRLKKNGTNITGQYLLMNDWSFSSNGGAFGREIENTLTHVGKYVANLEIGNETNLYPKYNTLAEAMTRYLECEYKPGYEAAKKNNLSVMASGVYLSQREWLEQVYSSGLWNHVDALSTHAYSFPHSPDKVSDEWIEHSFESALARTRTFLNAAGDKKWYVSEMGYPTTPEAKENMFSGVDLRTQADYTVREFALALAYGADVVESYGFYDQMNMQKGTKAADCEYHYGMFYDQDYFGRIMPKPLAFAYGSMTRQLESVRQCYAVDKGSDTIRAFQFVLDDSNTNTFMVWSNCSPLDNDAVEGKRKAVLPWENQWEGSETLSLYTTSEVTATDIMGNTTTYIPDKKGIVSIPVTGSPLLLSGDIYGTK